MNFEKTGIFVNTKIVSEVSFPFLERESKAFDHGQNVEKFSVALFENINKVSR